MSGLYGPYPKIEPALTKLTEEFLDWQWNDYLSKEVSKVSILLKHIVLCVAALLLNSTIIGLYFVVQVPQEYIDELSGLAAGSLSAHGIADGDKLASR